ncbi:MAG: hypothetical protein HC842_07835 [Cytophagales bacterium]|nr:hypothetical protein [Cytophagales bacterium]
MMKLNRLIFLGLLLALVPLVNCEYAESEGIDVTRLELRDAPFFSGAQRIRVPAYGFVYDTRGYTNAGDSLIYLINTTAPQNRPGVLRARASVPNRPTLNWIPSRRKLVAAAIFRSRIQVGTDAELFDDERPREILNPHSMVWYWDSSLSQEGTVLYAQGRSVVNGEPQYELPAEPLEMGKAYIWAVWAWNDLGTKIEMASAELVFRVEGNRPDAVFDY